jgi:hypothetical protein
MQRTSKYRSGELEIANEDWNAANRDYESATIALETDQRALEGAEARGKKGQISDAKNQVAAATKKVEAAHIKLDSLPKTRSQEIERPYTYTEQINHLKATVELQFRILDTAGSSIVPHGPDTRNPGEEFYHPGRTSKLMTPRAYGSKARFPAKPVPRGSRI